MEHRYKVLTIFSAQHSSLWSRSRSLLRCTTGLDFFLAEGKVLYIWNIYDCFLIPVMCLASLAISHQRRTLKDWTDQCRRESFYSVLFCQCKSLWSEVQYLFYPPKINHIGILTNHFQSFSGPAEGNHVMPQEMDDDDFILASDENDHFILV